MNLKMIQNGEYSVVINQAQDYLNYILKNKPNQAKAELHLFIEQLLLIKKLQQDLKENAIVAVTSKRKTIVSITASIIPIFMLTNSRWQT